MPEESKSYIAKYKCGCGGIVFAMVDVPNHKKETAKEVARAIREGYSVELVDSEVVRQSPFGCQAKKEAKHGPA
jgi:hypothetical protein